MNGKLRLHRVAPGVLCILRDLLTMDARGISKESAKDAATRSRVTPTDSRRRQMSMNTLRAGNNQ